MQADNTYPAKLLLFGEHTVLKGSSSLAVPYPTFDMSWIKKKDDHPSWLAEYCSYLSVHCSQFLDIKLLENWIEDNTIAADIPIGYGLGSSGALTAAIYDIAKIKSKEDPSGELSSLQQNLGLMESYFHGKSSGFDPLISYLKSPILRKDDKLHVLETSAVNLPLHCFLLDSGSARSGKEMIAQFLENYDVVKAQVDHLSDLNNKVINKALSETEAEALDFYKDIKSISQLQQEVMPYMIIDDLKPYWQKGINYDEYYIKICGAGGGGYYLVFSMKELSNLGPFKLQKVFS